jgi:integrase
MHKQHPKTAYRNMPFLIGTIFENCDKWYRTWRAEHPEFEKIVFHGLRHSSATYQLMISGGDVKTVQRPCKWRIKRKSTRNLTILRGILVRSRELESLAL